MKHYIIDLYKNDEWVITYELSDESIETAIRRVIQEAYYDDYDVDYYIAYTEENNESKEGWV